VDSVGCTLAVGGKKIRAVLDMPDWTIPLLDIRWNGMRWIDEAQDRGQWRVLMDTVINLQAL
jgi:hypothetical protein